MKSESSIAWRNLNQAIEAVAAARPADMTAAAANLLQARTSYEQSTAVLPDPPLDTSSMSIWDRIKVKLQNTQQRLNRWENTWKKALLRKTFGLAILILLFGYTLTVVFGLGVSMGYMVTAYGLLLVSLSLLAPYKFLQDLTTFIGVCLVGWWYINSLPGVFNPVKNVMLDTAPEHSGYYAAIKIKEGKQACLFTTDSATLICEVQVVAVPQAIVTE